MRCFLVFFILVSTIVANAQDNTYLTFVPKFKEENLQLNKPYVFENDTISISNLKYYISNLRYFKNDTLVYTSKKKAHLIDLSSAQSLQINEKTSIKFDQIKFNIGIDSLTSVSGVLEGDLDPINGMYWTWQSGYINFKLEGIASNYAARNQKYYWHIGGYQEPFYMMREISLKYKQESAFNIAVQIDELFGLIDISEIYQVMSPNEKAIQIADKLPVIFKTVVE